MPTLKAKAKKNRKPQFERPRVICKDGWVRYPYIAVQALSCPPPIPSLPSGRLGKKGDDPAIPLTRDGIENFEKIWGELYLSYFGERSRFIGKKLLNKNKLRVLAKILGFVKHNRRIANDFQNFKLLPNRTSRTCQAS